MRSKFLILSLLVEALNYSQASAQVLRGHVVDRQTLVPVPSASVLLLDESGAARATLAVDEAGAFTLALPAAGTYRLRVNAQSYSELLTQGFRVALGDTTELLLRISAEPTVLESVTVKGEQPPFIPPGLDGFHQRRARGFGFFMTREEIENRGAARFTHLFSAVPGVRVVRLPVTGGLAQIKYTTLRVVGAVPRYHGLAGVEPCVPQLWLDGVPLGNIDEVTELGPDFFLSPDDLEGIEVYRRGSEIPAEFRGREDRCGVIVAWTRRSP